MKRKLKWLAPLTAGVLAVTLGLTAFTSLTTKTYAYQALSSEVSNLSATQTDDVYGNSIILGTDHYTDLDMPYGFLDSEIVTSEGVYFNGFLYKRTGDIISAYAANPSEITVLVLEKKIDSIPVDYNNVDFATYTACTDVVVRTNSSNAYDQEISLLPACKNLYYSGLGRMTVNFTSQTIENIYFLSYYYGPAQLGENYLGKCLPNLAVKNVYYTSYNKDFLSMPITLFNSAKYKNNAGEIVYAKEATSFKFDTRICFPFKEFDPEGEKFLGNGYYATSYQTDTIKFDLDMYFKHTSYDERVYDYNSPVRSGTSLYVGGNNDVPTNFNTLVALKVTDCNFNQLSGKELVISKVRTFNPTYCHGFDTVRYVYDPNDTFDVTISSYATTANINKIMIPNEYKSHFVALESHELTKDKLEYYDQASYTPPKSSFRYNDKIYTVSCNKYPIDDLIAGMTAKNITSNEEDIDVALLNAGYTLRESQWTGIEGPDGIINESEFVNGYQGLGTIYYSSNKSIEEVLKIASKYILQNNGIRVDDASSYTVDFMVDGNQLSTTIKMNNKIVSSMQSSIHKVDSKEYGEFIYLQNVACTYGELLIDTDSVTTHNINEIYEYAVGQTTNLTTFNKTTVTDFNIKMPSSADLETTYVHSNGNTYKAVCEALSFDLDQVLSQSNNCTITFKKLISPDDDKEDAASQYSVKTITKIYVPKMMSAHGIPSSINPNIIRYIDNVYDTSICLHILTSTNKHDGSNYEITMAGTLPDGVWYTHEIPVEVLQGNYNVGFVVCEDGTMIVVKMAETPMTLDTLKNETQSFLTSKLNSSDSITLAENINLNTTQNYVGSKYGTKNLDIVVSGVAALHESSATTPVDQTELKKGYTALSSIVFTKNYTPEQAAKAIADKILYYNGTPVPSNYKVKVTVYSNSFGFEFYNVNNEKLYSIQSTYKVVDDTSVSFIAASSDYHTGIILSDTKDITVGTFMNDIMKDVVSLAEYDFNSNVVMSTTGPTNLKGTYHHSNQNYYNYDYTVKVLNVTDEIAASKVEVTISSTETPGGNTGNSGNNTEKPTKPTDDKDDSVVDTIKDKMENNQAFKYSMMAVGTILGVLLVYGAYLLIRKFVKWLKH